MNTTPTIFEDIPYDEVDQYHDYCYGYSESTDYEYLSSCRMKNSKHYKIPYGVMTNEPCMANSNQHR